MVQYGGGKGTGATINNKTYYVPGIVYTFEAHHLRSSMPDPTTPAMTKHVPGTQTMRWYISY